MDIPLPTRLFYWLFQWAFPFEMAMNGPVAERDDTGSPETIWLQQIAAGNTQALRQIFDRWKLPLLTYFYRAIGSHADAEDLTLQTLTRVYRSAHRYRPEAKFSTWLFTIARHELLHELRRRKRKPVEAVQPDQLDALSTAQVGAPGHAQEVEEQLLVALQGLPERDRSALLMASGGDLSNSEIARTLGVSNNHLNVLLHRARLKLRELFSSQP